MRTKITPHKKGEKRRSREVIFTRAHVSLALLSLRKNGDYSWSNNIEGLHTFFEIQDFPYLKLGIQDF